MQRCHTVEYHKNVTSLFGGGNSLLDLDHNPAAILEEVVIQ